MNLDTTAIGLLAGLIGCALFALVEFWKKRELTFNSALIFPAVFAIATGARLISVAIEGDFEKLPVSWREYLTLAGVGLISFSLNFVIQTVKKLGKEETYSE